MTSKKNLAVSAVAATSMVLAGATPALAVTANEEPAQNEYIVAMQATESEDLFIKADASLGSFSWDQSILTPTWMIRDVFRPATNALCGATEDFAATNPLQWKISVLGDVEHVFTATIDEMAQEQVVKQAMTCSCGGNPSDGKAIITAEVKGIPVNYLINRAEAEKGANTITFVASDGTESAMSLAYAMGHHGVISYEINDEDLSASVGGNNQLWLAGTSANYFIRDIVEVRITAENEPPLNPGEEMEYPNSPNIGLLSAATE